MIQEESGGAALLVTDLNKLLTPKAKHFRELQGEESSEFAEVSSSEFYEFKLTQLKNHLIEIGALQSVSILESFCVVCSSQALTTGADDTTIVTKRECPILPTWWMMPHVDISCILYNCPLQVLEVIIRELFISGSKRSIAYWLVCQSGGEALWGCRCLACGHHQLVTMIGHWAQNSCGSSMFFDSLPCISKSYHNIVLSVCQWVIITSSAQYV